MEKISLDEPEKIEALPSKKSSPAQHISNRVAFGYKCIAFLVVFVALIWHGTRFTQPGNDTCSQLFSEGRWVKNLWQPYGCMMHSYMPRYTQSCYCVDVKRYSTVAYQLGGQVEADASRCQSKEGCKIVKCSEYTKEVEVVHHSFLSPRH